MKVLIPAMKGTMGGRDYYSCLVKLKDVRQMFDFRDWSEFSAEERQQRVLTQSRIPDIARYITENEEGYLFSSLTASFTIPPDAFDTLPGNPNMGVLQIETPLVINDGQHRAAGIDVAIRQNPALAEEEISVLLFPAESPMRAQQMFSDLNRFVAKTSKSLDILYDKRDVIAQALVVACKKVPAFVDMVDMDSVTLTAGSRKLFTLTALYEATKELLGAEHGVVEMPYSEMEAFVIDFWAAVGEMVPGWQMVQNGTLTAVEMRRERISAHSVVLRALGSVGRELVALHPADWKAHLARLRDVDFRKSNKEWENVCIVAGSVVSNRQSRVATRAYLKHKLGLSLAAGEIRANDRREAHYDGAWLRHERTVRQLKQTDIMAVLGVSNTTVSEWENGHKPIPSDTVSRLLFYFKEGKAEAA